MTFILCLLASFTNPLLFSLSMVSVLIISDESVRLEND